MAAFLQWRRFVFFDKETVKDPSENGKNVQLPVGITASDSGRGHIVLGDILKMLKSCLRLVSNHDTDKQLYKVYFIIIVV